MPLERKITLCIYVCITLCIYVCGHGSLGAEPSEINSNSKGAANYAQESIMLSVLPCTNIVK